jgi:hypothetical protein
VVSSPQRAKNRSLSDRIYPFCYRVPATQVIDFMVFTVTPSHETLCVRARRWCEWAILTQLVSVHPSRSGKCPSHREGRSADQELGPNEEGKAVLRPTYPRMKRRRGHQWVGHQRSPLATPTVTSSTTARTNAEDEKFVPSYAPMFTGVKEIVWRSSWPSERSMGSDIVEYSPREVLNACVY